MARILISFALLASLVFGQAKSQQNQAPPRSSVTLRANFSPELQCGRTGTCEMREETVRSTGRFDIDQLHNGEVIIRGWDRNEVRVRLRVSADSVLSSKSDAFSRIRTRIEPGRVSVSGPESTPWGWFNGGWWNVSAEVFVPHKTDLRIKNHNGRVRISDISGRVDTAVHNGATEIQRVVGVTRVSSHNGALNLDAIDGDVTFESHNGSVRAMEIHQGIKGTSSNGSVTIELAGANNSSRRVDLESHNGKLQIGLPGNFGASVRTETHHGSVKSDFPVNARLDGSDFLRNFDIGSGGLLIRAKTHNGAIQLRRL